MTDKIKLYYNNVEIYNDVPICGLIHEMHSEKLADSLTVRLNDVSGMWSNWNPVEGDQVRLQYQYADTGVMYVNSLSAENGIFAIRALSVPAVSKEKKSRSWEGLSFIRLISQIASEYGLSYKCYGVQERIYKYISQDNETNFEFLQRICEYESCAFTVYNKTIIVYDEIYMEGREGESIIVGENGMFNYHKNNNVYSACTVTNGKINGIFETGQGSSVLKKYAPATSRGEASRFATGLLRSANKNSLTGTFRKSLHTQYSPASTAVLETEKASMWNKKVFLTRVRHDYLMNSTDVYFRGILEGY